MFRRGLRAKILALTMGLSLVGFGVLVFLVVKEEEKSILSERLRSTELMSHPILHSIYKDMLDERADMSRFLIDGLKTIKGVERVQIIRSNGVEEAFQDHKTLKAVEKEFGEIKSEWIEGHPDKANNVAQGIDNADFKRVMKAFNEGKKDPEHYIETVGDRQVFTYVVPIVARAKCSACHASKDGARGVLMISTSLDEMYGQLSGTRNKWILYGLMTVGTMTVLLGILVSVVITRPVDRAVTMLKDISEGKGEFTKRLDESSHDEIGQLGKWFNKFVDGMQHMVGDIYGISSAVTGASHEIQASSKGLSEAVRKQLSASEEMSKSIKEMDASIKTIAEQAETLHDSSRQVSASSQTMSNSVDEAKVNIEKLFFSASSTTSSINEIAVSINDVASNVDELFVKTEDVVSSIMQISTNIKEVENYSRRQAELAERVRGDAEDFGLSSVVKTREGIEKVSEEVASTAQIVNRLGERSKEIGKILTVINDIADTTHLLALNATILAAQAGEHGKGFAVVARQVKDLATKTTSSTKEIAELISQVQREVGIAVESMHRSSGKVEDGVRLSRDAQEALIKILDSARRSFDMAKLIEKATIEQAKGAGQVSAVAQNINEMVAGIKNATNEQSSAVSEILTDTAQMKEFMVKVKTSANEQSGESKRVLEEIFLVADNINKVVDATTDQMELSKRIVQAVETVRTAAKDNANLASRLERTVTEMNKQADTLINAVGSFKT